MAMNSEHHEYVIFIESSKIDAYENNAIHSTVMIR